MHKYVYICTNIHINMHPWWPEAPGGVPPDTPGNAKGVRVDFFQFSVILGLLLGALRGSFGAQLPPSKPPSRATETKE